MSMSSFALPKLSATMEEGVIVRWLKAVGDEVAAGEPLVEVETDKAVIEVESPVTGRLAAIFVEEGAPAAVGEAIAQLETDRREPLENEPDRRRPLAADEMDRREPAGEVDGAARPEPGSKERLERGAAPARRPVSPAARRRARELGVDLDGVTGTGPGGRVRVEDVERAAAGRMGGSGGAAAGSEGAGGFEGLGGTGASGGAAPASAAYERMRQGVIETVTQSHREIPVFWVERWVELERVFALKSELDAAPSGAKITLTDFLIQAVADTLPSHPRLLTRLTSTKPLRETVERDPAVGLVVRVPGGVVVPTLSGLKGLGLAGVSRLRSTAAEAARSGRLSGAMLAPATVSLSNVGNTGVDVLRPMVLPGQTAILGVGRAHERVVPRERAIAISVGCSIVLAADHRVVDGVEAAAFLGALAERIEKGEWRT